MDDLTLFGKLPKAAEELGEASVKIEQASGTLAATMMNLKDAAKHNLAASAYLREIVEELKRRAEKRESKEGGKK